MYKVTLFQLTQNISIPQLFNFFVIRFWKVYSGVFKKYRLLHYTNRYFRSRNFHEQKLSRISRILPKFVKVSDAKNSILTDSRNFIHAKFFNFFFFSLNLLTALDNALILVSCSKKSRCQCNTKTRSASIAI